MEQFNGPETNDILPTTEAISNIDSLLKEKGIKYYVIGSIARNAYMGKPPSKGKDIDLLIPKPNNRIEAQAIIDEIQKKSTVSIDSSLSIYITEEGGQYYLTYGNIKESIDVSTMIPQRIEIEGVAFDSLPPETLLHTYTLVGGFFREKDWNNSLEFARWIKYNIKYDHNKYLLFHKFGKDKWKKSPLKRVQHTWRQTVKKMPPSLQSVLLDNIYNDTTIINARKLFNELEQAFCGR